MYTIEIEGVEDLLEGLKGMERQIPYAVANGLNATGRRVKESMFYAMQGSFDRPTPFTLNSLQLTPALAPSRGGGASTHRNYRDSDGSWKSGTTRAVTTPSLVARVWFKDPPKLGQKGHYLLPQVEGGKRPKKPFEPLGRFIVPGSGARLDQYGNLGRGQITKLLSRLGGFQESGWSMNTRDAKKKREFFRLLERRGKLPPGIYERVIGDEAAGRAGRFLLARAIIKGSKQKGALKALSDRTKSLYPRGARPVIIFTKQPSYTKRFDFYGIAERVVDANFRQDMTEAIEAEIEREMAYRARRAGK